MEENNLIEKLHMAVDEFKALARKTHPEFDEKNDNGEWELDYMEFGNMVSAALYVTDGLKPDEVSADTIDDLLYTIARDNECMSVIKELSPEWYSFLCKLVLRTPYINAKWQFAECLKNHAEDGEIKPLIFEFLESGDEYTERMALESLAVLYPDKAEEYAERFWERNIYEHDEYQKIMALHILYKIGSSKLDYYLDLADNSSYEYLKMNAKEIRQKRKK